jgi:catechol 2,3-dioxygenase-like lactoylglutathione lyase family enzyme
MAAPSKDIQVKHVNHVVTGVREAPRSIGFYCGLLGFKQIPSMGQPEYYPAATAQRRDATPDREPGCPRTSGSVHHAFEVEDFDASVKALQEKGVTVERSGVRYDGQGYLFIRDPDGNGVELCTPSGF